ncbi:MULTISPECIES: GGDEF domain-containing protein [unclassified Shewanella]|uniref:GGDEF domain-containing protein n=1 Tax=unclassified Shewanella TaxID=196818 RepID=UPI001BC8282E|nr:MULTISPECIES: GGDEF domain-containing protein [unclassified Shewanella]GIU04838.1 GGDEF domain-containing protein [Shewanella sp. MBTL60-112-B1]GIU24722.1 GGDEF domain-containing protein [Shewanella sp. MBTL60-112-B2]
MPKLSLLIQILLFVSALSVCSLSFATQTNTQKADEIFAIIDSGTIDNSESYHLHLAQLESLVLKSDTPRFLRLKRAQCWSFNPYEKEQIPAALAFAKQVLNYPELSQFPHHKLDLELCHTWFTEKHGNVEVAQRGYNKIIEEAYALENLRLVADARNMRGYLRSYQGNFTQGLEDLLIAHALYQNLNLPVWANSSLYEIATSYRRLGEYANAIRYFKRLQDKHISNNNFDGANAISVSIAIAEEEQGNLDVAKWLFEESHTYWKENKKELEQATVAVNIAGTLIKLGEIAQAHQYLNEAEPFILPTDTAFYSFLHLFRAQVYLAENRLPQAHKSIAYARTAFSRVKNIRGLAQLQLVESQAFLKQEDWKQAYYALSEYMRLHMELDSKQLSSYTTEMRTRFNADQIEQENRHLIENQQLKELELSMLEQNKLQQGIIIFLGGFIILIASVFARKQIQKNKLLSALALTDDLTQLPNRRYIYTKAQTCFEQAQKTDSPLSVITFDVDYFKLINDKYGHEVGDDALKFLADTCREVLATQNKTARIGGEEFLILLPNTDLAKAYKIAQALVHSVRYSDFSPFPADFSMTISAGVASLSATDSKLSQLFKKADDALYVAKNEGRNQARIGQ